MWLPLAAGATGYQRSLGESWSGNAASVTRISDAVNGVPMLYAEFPAEVKAPTLTLVNRLRTRSRTVDWSRPGAFVEDPAVLEQALAATELLPLDGLVRKTSLEATQGATTDVAKARAVYDWVLANAHREPKVRGCGNGDIETMLETGNLGGKGADLNALFVGRAAPPECRHATCMVCDWRRRRLAGANGRKPGQSEGRAALPRRGLSAPVRLGGDGPRDVLKVMRQETPQWIKDVKHPWWHR